MNPPSSITTTPPEEDGVDFLRVGEIVPLKKLIEDCDVIQRGETTASCYDRTTKFLFQVRMQRVIREVILPPSTNDVVLERRDAMGNKTTQRLSRALSKSDSADVLITYFDGSGKPTHTPVPVERPKIFDSKPAPKINLEDMRKY